MAGIHATMKELHKASKHRFFNRKWNGRMGILENLDRIRFLWLRTMEYGRQVSDIEAALKVVDSVLQDLYYTVTEIYNQMIVKRPGRIDKINFEHFKIALEDKFRALYLGVQVIDENYEPIEISDSEEDPSEDEAELMDECED
ncbi:uncharacterized protein LOC131022190 [Salvia miltiorrhiza]|uniref:uncharacterized protein LOC131022190 n=1 Tax=Salvia miltiorrhiza TaxID=226208 RepID=UPI0025AC09A6|nr:uncharacterized protein LOC131022190 [Salvia miltiorrhiza]